MLFVSFFAMFVVGTSQQEQMLKCAQEKLQEIQNMVDSHHRDLCDSESHYKIAERNKQSLQNTIRFYESSILRLQLDIRKYEQTLADLNKKKSVAESLVEKEKTERSAVRRKLEKIAEEIAKLN